MKQIISIIAIIFLISCSSIVNKDHTGALIISDTLKKASCVSLTNDAQNNLFISWAETDPGNQQKHFYMAAFDKSTGGFLPGLAIPVEQNVALHEEGMPKLAIKSDGTMIVVYETANPTEKNKFAGNIKFVVSSDKGRSWTRPEYLHQDTTTGKSHSFAAITRLADGEIGACWLDASVTRNGRGRPVKFAKTSAANIFTSERIIDSVACECCRLGINSASNGGVAIAFRDIIRDSIRDLSVITSKDNGQNFTDARSFSTDGWVIDGCPHNGPSVCLDEQNTYVAWFTGSERKGVYFGELNDQMQLIRKRLVSAQGRFIQLCQLLNGTCVLAFNESRVDASIHYNKIILNKIVNGQVFSLEIDGPKSSAGYPVVKALSLDQVMVAWSQDDKIYYTVVDVNLINEPVSEPQPFSNLLTSGSAAIKTSGQEHSACGTATRGGTQSPL